MIVLNYHGLTDAGPGDAWTLTQALFETHLDLCQGRLITPQAFLERCDADTSVDNDGILVTLDDACLSDYTQVYGRYMAAGRLPGFMCFVPVDAVGQSGRMTWEMIAELDRAGVLVGSHGMAHADLTSVTAAELDRELRQSKAVLEDRLGRPVTHLAFPYGKFSSRVWRAALAIGYTHLFTIQLGHHRGFEPFLYSRLCVTNGMDAAYMRRHLADPNAFRGRAWRISNAVGLYRPLMRLRYR